MSDIFDDYSSDKYGRMGDSRPPEIDVEADKARKEYQRLLASDDLDTTIDNEAKFLAKMYVCAEHFGVLKEYKRLIEDAMRVRPDKVKDAAKVFDSLSGIYAATADAARAHRDDLEGDGHFVGDAADGYYQEFDKLRRHIDVGDRSLSRLASNTADLFDTFGDALASWRKGISEAIRLVAEMERDRTWAEAKGTVASVFTRDPYEAAGKSLEALMESWYRTEKDARNTDKSLQEFAKDRGFDLEDAKYDTVGRSDVYLPDPWEGSLK